MVFIGNLWGIFKFSMVFCCVSGLPEVNSQVFKWFGLRGGCADDKAQRGSR